MPGDRHLDYVHIFRSAVADIRKSVADVARTIDRPLFIIDIAVPRNVDPNVNEMAGVYLYDIDSLQSVADNRSPSDASKSPRRKKSSRNM